MSGSSITDPDVLFGDADGPGLSGLFVRPVRQLAFWAAVVLPFLHLPLLATGLQSQQTVIAFVALVAVNVVALVLGQGHK
jgi:hypothetical protein